ncbi:MAG: hypothetical protein JXQ75_16525 [Phycisphaerae bacterium]|nr:hypothetical protein [Phycisphaerae bacterium]
MMKAQVSWKATLRLVAAMSALSVCLGCPIGSDNGDGTTDGTGGSLPSDGRVIFLHHSTGENIWNGGVAEWFDAYNSNNGRSYAITERAYPDEPYPWQNYPYDYWNIWVNHAGSVAYEGQDTLEILTSQYEVIVFKHCFPVSFVEPDSGSPDVSSDVQTMENYQLQYTALRDKLLTYPDNRFLVWTGASLTQTAVMDGGGTQEFAERARQFFEWVKTTWDEQGDNIFVFDFFELETEGGIYMLDAYAEAPDNPHPNETFSQTVAPLFAQRVVDVIEGRGDTGSLTGQ